MRSSENSNMLDDFKKHCNKNKKRFEIIISAKENGMEDLENAHEKTVLSSKVKQKLKKN